MKSQENDMSDETLDAAKEEVITEEVVDLEEAAEEVVEEVDEEITEEEIPDDNKERSNLGRKLSALFKKNDKMEDVIAQQAELIGRLMPQEYDEEEDLPVTRKEMNQFLNQQKTEANQYENDFKETFHKMCEANGLSDDDAEAIGGILLEKYNNRVVGDGKLDGAMNFEKARSEYFSPKKTILKNGKAPGVITKQKSAVKQQKTTKLDAVSEKYLSMITRLDGAEKADRLRKSL